MLTTNINIKNRLINEQMGTVKHIEIRDKGSSNYIFRIT